MFGKWTPLSAEALASFPAAPCAVQLRRAEGLVAYPDGKSAMVLYFFASTSAREVVARVLAPELEAPGAFGEGPLWIRFGEDDDDQRGALERLFATFAHRFGAVPVLTPVLSAAASHAEQYEEDTNNA